jgi:mono/diheme cytochrome c family protein
MGLMTLVACGGGDETSADASAADRELAAGRRTSTALVAQPANTEGRLLASNCFQCHGTLGTGGFDKIRGSEASEVLEFMTKTANRDIMAAHAQGYTPDQLNKIIAYLKQ